jgi:hypothetical protein
MALMVPSAPAGDTPSNAERKLFVRMQHGLDDSWIVLHSVGLACHKTKPWAEIDFVLIGPSGVFLLEVKGGRVSRVDGMWHFVNAEDEVSKKQEGPFDQVGSAAAALFAFLKIQLPFISAVPLGYGCAFPDIHFEMREPDIIPDVVYDERDYELPFAAYVKRLVAYWKTRLRRAGFLSPAERVAILKRIRPDFDFRPDLHSRARDVKQSLIRLTEEQYEVLDLLAENDRVLVRGGAGTGKTLLAVEEAKRSVRAGSRVLFCCFNRLLKDHALGILREFNPSIGVYTIHGLMQKIISEAGLDGGLPKACDEDLYSKFFPEMACTAIINRGGPEYEVLILDEAQDLAFPSYFDFLDLLVRGGLKSGKWRAFYDPKQDIYVDGVGQIKRFIQLSPARATLSVNCRNTQPIGTHVALLSGFPLSETLRVSGPDVEMHYYRDFYDGARSVQNTVNRVLSEGIEPREIVILVPTRNSIGHLKQTLKVAHPLVELHSSEQPEGSLAISTISSFKGLERDCAVVAELERLEDQGACELLYVAASRPRVLLSIHTHERNREWIAGQAQRFGEQLESGRD